MTTTSRRLRIRNRDLDADVAVKLQIAFPVKVCGSDSRTLERVVAVVAKRGLEIRDAHGHLLLAAERLMIAWGYTPERARLRQRWTVIVCEPTRAVPKGDEWHIEPWGNRPVGRRVVFNRDVDAGGAWRRQVLLDMRAQLADCPGATP